jgi:hypothetical protein
VGVFLCKKKLNITIKGEEGSQRDPDRIGIEKKDQKKFILFLDISFKTGYIIVYSKTT